MTDPFVYRAEVFRLERWRVMRSVVSFKRKDCGDTTYTTKPWINSGIISMKQAKKKSGAAT